MDFYFNELSLTPLPNLATANDVLTKFVHCCTSLRKLGMKSLRLSVSFTNFEIVENYCIYDWLKDESQKKEIRQQFKSIATRSPIIATEDKNLLEEAKQNDVYFDNKQTFGLMAAFIGRSLALSFISHPIWINSSISALQVFYDAENQFKENKVVVRHISLIEHLLEHKLWFKRVLPMPEYDFSQPLPFSIVSKFMLPIDFYQETVNLNTDECIAIYKNWSEKIATANWYEFNAVITQMNGNRDIYHLGEGRNRIYLALDTQHGRFECCDHQGIHKGEFDFYGNLTKEADTKGKHNIRVK
jgi:hypothetical protein